MKKILGWLCVLILSAMLGGILGEIIAKFLSDGWFHDAATKGIHFAAAPATLDVKALALTVGIKAKVTAFWALGAVLGGLVYWKFS